MARVVVVSSNQVDSLYPLSGAAEWLARFGNAIHWIFYPQIPERFRKTNPPATKIETKDPQLSPTPDFPTPFDVFLREVESAVVRVEPLRKQLKRLKPHYVLLGADEYAGIAACLLETIPFAVTTASLSWLVPHEEVQNFPLEEARYRKVIDQFFDRYSLTVESRAHSVLSPHINAVATNQELVGFPIHLPRKTFLVGPIAAPAMEPKIPPGNSRPWVFITEESGEPWAPHEISLITEAANLLGWDVVKEGPIGALNLASLKSVNQETFASWLAQSELVFSRGNGLRVMLSLRSGRPLLLAPHTTEGLFQAHFLQRQGLAPLISFSEHTKESLAELIKLTAAPSPLVKAKAEALKASFARQNGGKNLAEMMSGLLPRDTMPQK